MVDALPGPQVAKCGTVSMLHGIDISEHSSSIHSGTVEQVYIARGRCNPVQLDDVRIYAISVRSRGFKDTQPGGCVVRFLRIYHVHY